MTKFFAFLKRQCSQTQPTEVTMKTKYLFVAILALVAIGFASPVSAQTSKEEEGDLELPCRTDFDNLTFGVQECPKHQQESEAPITLAPKGLKSAATPITFTSNPSVKVDFKPVAVSENVYAFELNSSVRGGYTDLKYGSWVGGELTMQGLRYTESKVGLIVGLTMESAPKQGAGNFYLSTLSENANVTLLNPFLGIRHQNESRLFELKVGTALDPEYGSWTHPLTVNGTAQWFFIDSLGVRAEGQSRLFGKYDTWDLKGSGVWKLPTDKAELRIHAGPELVHYNVEKVASGRSLGVQGGLTWSITEGISVGITAAHAKPLGITGGLNFNFSLK